MAIIGLLRLALVVVAMYTALALVMASMAGVIGTAGMVLLATTDTLFVLLQKSKNGNNRL